MIGGRRGVAGAGNGDDFRRRSAVEREREREKEREYLSLGAWERFRRDGEGKRETRREPEKINVAHRVALSWLRPYSTIRCIDPTRFLIL